MLFGEHRAVIEDASKAALDRAEHRIAGLQKFKDFTSANFNDIQAAQVVSLLLQAKADLQDLVQQVRSNTNCLERGVWESLGAAIAAKR